MINTLEWTPRGVVFIDQTKLPTEEVYVTCTTHQQVADVIRNMVVRGAPAIGVAAAMGIALGVKNSKAQNGAHLKKDFDQICETIRQTRPTAVNLFWAIRRMTEKFETLRVRPIAQIQQALIEEAQRMHAEDIAANQAMGRHGETLMPSTGAVLPKEHGIPFYVAAPISTVDLATPDGSKIPIEQRNAREVTHIAGKQMVPDGVQVENPAFDVTPAKYVTAIITERGIARAPYEQSLSELVRQLQETLP